MKTRDLRSSRNLFAFFRALMRVLAAVLTLSALSLPVRAEVELVVTALNERATADIQTVRQHASVLRTAPVFSSGERLALKRLNRSPLSEALKITLANEESAMALQKWVRARKLQVLLEANAVSFTLASAPVSHDILYPRQWALENTGQVERLDTDDLASIPIQGVPGEDIGLTRAPPENMDSRRAVTVAVLDSGIDYAHPDLENKLVESPSECRALVAYTKCLKEAAQKRDELRACDETYASQDNDGNGYPLDCSGWNVTGGARSGSPGSQVLGDPDPIDKIGHGTHVAGIIAAASDKIGVRGVLQNVRILPVKVITAAPAEPVRPTEDDHRAAEELPSANEKELAPVAGLGDVVARGMLYALRSGAQVINMSLGWPASIDSNLMREMIDLARERDILVVSAAGNDATDALIRPCVYPGVICVASHDPDGSISNFSNFGSGVDIAAPGMNILSTFLRSSRSIRFVEAVGYEMKSGTSMAAPHVAGLLARLVNSGIPPREAYARLMAGARESKPSSVRSTAQGSRYTVAGNADLAGALKAEPQPLILPVEKSALPIFWNRTARKVPFSFQLKNFWAPSQGAVIQARVVETRGTSVLVSPDASLETSTWATGPWHEQEAKTFKSALVIDDARLGSDLRLELRVQTREGVSRTLLMQAEIRVPIDEIVNDSEVQTLPIQGSAELQGASLRSVLALDDDPAQDYIAIKPMGAETEYLLVKDQDPSGYVVKARRTAATRKDELLLLQRLDLDSNGQSDYVLIYRRPETPDKRQRSFVFEILDADLRPLPLHLNGARAAVHEFSNSVAVLSDRFQWMSLEDGGRVPAWVARGTTPELEVPEYNPWHPDPIDFPAYRVYYMARDGLRTVSAPQDHAIIGMLALSKQNKRDGSLSVLYAKGKGTETEYAVGEIHNGRMRSFQEISLGMFRALRGTDLTELVDLSVGQNRLGTVFSTKSHRLARRITTLVDTDTGPGPVNDIIDRVVSPMAAADIVTRIAGVYAGDHRQGIMSQTLYDLQYMDLRSGDQAITSLRRFSFLPGVFFFSLFFPVVIGDSLADDRSGDRLPGMYIASGLGLSTRLEVITPRYDDSGELVSLLRPARFRFEESPTCVSLENALPATRERPTQLAFFCGDRFLRVPLLY